MSTMEIISGILLILASVVVIFVVLSQESKGKGLSGVITGTEMMSGETRSHTKDARLARMTKVVAIIFVVLTILVNLFNSLFS